MIFRRYFPEGTEDQAQAVFEAIVGTSPNLIVVSGFATNFWLANGIEAVGETEANSPSYDPLNLVTYLRDGWKVGPLQSTCEFGRRHVSRSSSLPLRPSLLAKFWHKLPTFRIPVLTDP